MMFKKKLCMYCMDCKSVFVGMGVTYFEFWYLVSFDQASFDWPVG